MKKLAQTVSNSVSGLFTAPGRGCQRTRAGAQTKFAIWFGCLPWAFANDIHTISQCHVICQREIPKTLGRLQDKKMLGLR